MSRSRFCLLCLLFLLPLSGHAAAPSVALFYGTDAPLAELQAFDIAVVDPDHGSNPRTYRSPHSELYAYVSIGEAHPDRAWFKDLPPTARLTRNADWGSLVIDLSRPEWADFVADRIVAPLWQAGYRGFFLDTLDSYRLAAQFDENAQQRGLIRVIETLHQRFPGIRLILNRGFDVVPAVHDKIAMVAAESLFRGWNAARQQYIEVPVADRDWLLGQLQKVRDSYGLPVLAIDYVPPADRALTRTTAERIKALGIVPWVSDAALGSLGIGSVEVVPRRVLVLYDGREAPALNYTEAHRFGDLPLQYLGYIPEHRDLRQPLPALPLAGRYAGIVVWPAGQVEQPARLAAWLHRQVEQGLRIAFVGDFGFPLTRENERWLGLKVLPAASGRVELRQQNPMFGFEAPLKPPLAEEIAPLQLNGPGSPWLEIKLGQQSSFAAAGMPWGGFVLAPFVLRDVPGSDQMRWLVDPFAFLQQALALPALPAPDVTTENGRRLLTAHIDGDGFPSRGEFAGAPLAGKTLYEEILQRYRIPHAVSVIESEVAPHGLYPQDAAEMESIARRIFALPHVEMASHSFSHPFRWENSIRHGIFSKAGANESYHLPVPGYHFDIAREITGSIAYLNQHLAPPGKSARLLLWTGDTAPGLDALQLTDAAGLFNLNGGDTRITRSEPTLTAVAPLGIVKGGHLQIYAPVANENRYTNLWTGPFYGYRRVIETFTLTEQPRRLKPVGIYYHVYSATKPAALNALHEVYRWAQGHPLHPVLPSAYVEKVRDFMHATLARDGAVWVYRGNGALRTLRLPAALGLPDLAKSQGIAGFKSGSDGHYLHLSGSEARLHLTATMPTRPYLHDANARLEDWQGNERQFSFRLTGHQPLAFALANSGRCTVRADGRALTPVAGSNTFHYDHARAKIQVRCPAH